jgi:large repetitive protein
LYLATPGGLASGNYAITFNSANLSITKAALSVTAADATKVYGLTDPNFNVTYSGFVNSESASVAGGTLAFSRNKSCADKFRLSGRFSHWLIPLDW